MSMFHVGQMVVCVDDSGLAVDPELSQWPRAGMVYTIRGVRNCFSCWGILLEEIANEPPSYDVAEPDFLDRRFRPVKNTSIEIFRSLLSPIPEEVA